MIMKALYWLHNIISGARGDSYPVQDSLLQETFKAQELLQEKTFPWDEDTHFAAKRGMAAGTAVAYVLQQEEDIRNRKEHLEIKADMVEHILKKQWFLLHFSGFFYGFHENELEWITVV